MSDIIEEHPQYNKEKVINEFIIKYKIGKEKKNKNIWRCICEK